MFRFIQKTGNTPVIDLMAACRDLISFARLQMLTVQFLCLSGVHMWTKLWTKLDQMMIQIDSFLNPHIRWWTEIKEGMFWQGYLFWSF